MVPFGWAVGRFLNTKSRAFYFIIMAFTMAWNAHAQDFLPIFAADQPVLTTKSQEFEVAQFRELARWRSVDDKVSSLTEDVKRASENFERAKKLAASGAVSQSELDNKKFFYEQLSASLDQLKLEQRLAEISTELFKLRILEEGNPTKDFRIKIVELKIESVALEKRSNESSLEAAKGAESFFDTRVRNGQKLLKKSLISQVEFDQRRSQLLDAQNKVKVIEHQIEALNISATGLEKSRSRLLGKN